MSNKTFFWNVRGLNDPDKHPLFVNWLTSQQVCFGALLETHIKETQLNHVMTRTCRDWSFVSNHASDPDGRIIIIWRHPISITPLHQTRQSLTCEISIGCYQKFIYTVIYAANTSSERLSLWVDLLNLQQTFNLDSAPWIVGGDFNQITHCSEHSLPAVNTYDTPMLEFRDTLSDLGLFDIRYQ